MFHPVNRQFKQSVLNYVRPYNEGKTVMPAKCFELRNASYGHKVEGPNKIPESWQSTHL